jgi:uncharacterized membrane protein YfcA
MNALEVTLAIALAGVGTGFIGSLTGLGGGFVIVPLLTLLFGVDIRYAIGASLVCVIATSSGAAAAYISEGYTNIRVGMFLEIATTIGAIVGASLAPRMPGSAIAILFGLVMLHSAWSAWRTKIEPPSGGPPDRVSTWLRMDNSYPTIDGSVAYRVRHVPQTFGVMGIAGVLSGLLGIGSGVVKVLALDRIMGLPFKVSTTTSNFMIGVTAAASAGVYLSRGYIDPTLAMPVMLGVLAGGFLGARLLPGAKPRQLRLLFAGVLAVIAVEMIYKGASGKF